MARRALKHRNLKRAALATRFRSEREQLRAASKDIHSSEEARFKASLALQALPRDSSPSRYRKRCNLCSRPRAYNNLTGLCRLHMRIAVDSGVVPGVEKASW